MLNVLLLIINLLTSSVYAIDIPITGETSSPHYRSDEAKENLSLTKYDPVYFLYGTAPAKLQFSFKYKLINEVPFYLAYTQRMFWDLNKDSKPFQDINYTPEVFYRLKFKESVLQSLDVSPFSHSSNGRDGVQSRSLNKTFIQANLVNALVDSAAAISFRASYIFGEEDTTRRIRNYISPFDIKLTLTQLAPGILDRGELYLRFIPAGRLGQDWGRGSEELGLSFRLGGLHIAPSLLLQYFHGYAESLLKFDQLSNCFRLGLLL